MHLSAEVEEEGMAYQSLCDRFSQTATIGATLTTGAIASIVTDAVIHTTAPNALKFGLAAGAAGWVCGAITHGVVHAALSFNDVGILRGSRILKGAQMAAYAIGLTSMLALSCIEDEPSAPPESPATSVPKPIAPPAPAFFG